MAEMSERRDREVAPLVSFAPTRKILDLLSTRLESRRRELSRPLLALNLALAGLSVFFSIRIGHALFAPAPRSTSPDAWAVAAAGPRDRGAARNSPSSGAYDVIAAKNLFDPNRSQSTSSEVTAPRLPPAPTLALYGVAISDDTRVAFVQDLVTKQLSGYKTGDKLAGGQLERIEPDRVVIMRADGPIEVLLRRPKEPPAVVPPPEEPSPRRSRGRQD